MGLLYTDPNGIFDDGLLGYFSNKYPRIDILINCNSVAIKRNSAANSYDDLAERIKTIGKTKWIIRRSLGKSQWVFLLGSSWPDFPDWRDRGFFALDSIEGKKIWDNIALASKECDCEGQLCFPIGWNSYEDYLHSPEFGKVRQERMIFAKFRCEICNKVATEVNHRKYANWRVGEVDTVGNIIAICHECHCKYHGKEN